MCITATQPRHSGCGEEKGNNKMKVGQVCLVKGQQEAEVGQGRSVMGRRIKSPAGSSMQQSGWRGGAMAKQASMQASAHPSLIGVLVQCSQKTVIVCCGLHEVGPSPLASSDHPATLRICVCSSPPKAKPPASCLCQAMGHSCASSRHHLPQRGNLRHQHHLPLTKLVEAPLQRRPLLNVLACTMGGGGEQAT
jgi:hypothetical protein